MWHLNVPKILHIYWGGAKLVYMRYLTIKTFLDLNPGWDVIYWQPKTPFTGKSWDIEPGYEQWNQNICKNYLPELMKLPIHKQVVDFSSLGFRDNVAEVHKNDYIRISALHLYGGVWSDMDIIYFKPLTSLKVNIPSNKDKEVYVCISPQYGHSTGFNMAMKGSRFFGQMTNLMTKMYHPKEYQCWGPDIFNRYFKTIDRIPGGVNLSMDVVYAHNAYNVTDLLKNMKPNFNDESIGCHWYGGHSIWGAFWNQTGGGVRNLPDNIIGNLIKNAKNA